MDELTNTQLVAIWNILQWNNRNGQSVHPKQEEISKLLTNRGIPHSIGKRTIIYKEITK